MFVNVYLCWLIQWVFCTSRARHRSQTFRAPILSACLVSRTACCFLRWAANDTSDVYFVSEAAMPSSCCSQRTRSRGQLIRCEGLCKQTKHELCWGIASTTYKFTCKACITLEGQCILSVRANPQSVSPLCLSNEGFPFPIKRRLNTGDPVPAPFLMIGLSAQNCLTHVPVYVSASFSSASTPYQ